MSERSRREDGDYDTEYSTADILDVVKAHGPIGTSSVAEKIGCHRNSARYRLHNLADEGEIERIETGEGKESGYVWQF